MSIDHCENYGVYTSLTAVLCSEIWGIYKWGELKSLMLVAMAANDKHSLLALPDIDGSTIWSLYIIMGPKPTYALNYSGD